MNKTWEIWLRDNGRCYICDKRVYTRYTKKVDTAAIGYVHHINKDRRDNSLSNLILLCPQCHGYIHTLDDFHYALTLEVHLGHEILELHTWQDEVEERVYRGYKRDYEKSLNEQEIGWLKDIENIKRTKKEEQCMEDCKKEDCEE